MLPYIYSFYFLTLMRARLSIRTRNYIRSQALVDLPHSAWRRIIDHADELSFRNALGFSRESFSILAPLFMVNLRLDLTRSSLSSRDVLGLTLMYLTTSSKMKSFCLEFAVTPSTISKYIKVGLSALYRTAQILPQCRLSWPNKATLIKSARNIELKFGLPNVFGFVDGVYFVMEKPKDFYQERLYYNRYKDCCSATNVLLFIWDGTIIFANINHPGSRADSTLALPLYNILLDQSRTPGRLAIVADSAFSSIGALEGKVLTPLRDGDILPDIPALRKQTLDLNYKVVRTRVAAEWGMHAIRSVFRRLELKISSRYIQFNHDLLELVFRLYNFRCRTMIDCNQIQTVYDLLQYDEVEST